LEAERDDGGGGRGWSVLDDVLDDDDKPRRWRPH
jgi:hypothetical protein